jgi:hypothetical protein
VISVAVDVGRSSVKVAYTNGASGPEFFEIPSIMATSYSSFSNPNSSLVNSYLDREMYQVGVKETRGEWNKDFASFFMFGKQAQKQGGFHDSFSEGPQFHKFGVAVVLYAVARAVWTYEPVVRGIGFPVPCSDVAVAIDLTYSNNETVAFYSSALKGKHKVSLGRVVKGRVRDQDVSFNIVDLYCFQQGYASVFNFIGRKEFDIVSKGRGVVIDIGRFTVDLSRVEDLTLVGGKSVEFGTRVIVDSLQSAVAKDGVKLELDEIEDSFRNHDRVFANISGKSVKPWRVLVEGDFLWNYYTDVKMAVGNFVGEDRIDYIVLCGGGSYFIHDFFVKDFKVPLLSVDYVMANVTGMLAMMME